MTQVYSNPARESEAHALPDVETFHIPVFGFSGRAAECFACTEYRETWKGDVGEQLRNPLCDTGHGAHYGWYWQACLPGCLPDGEPNGPFVTEVEAIADAQSDVLDGAE